MCGKKRAGAPSKTPGTKKAKNPHMSEILAYFEQSRDFIAKHPDDFKFDEWHDKTIKTVGDLRRIVEMLAPRIDELAEDYKAFTRLDVKGLLRRFDGLRVMTNLKDAPNCGCDVSTWEYGPRDLTLDELSGCMDLFFCPDGEIGTMASYSLVVEAFARDWRLRLGVAPTTPMRDRMLAELVWNGPMNDMMYPWVPSDEAIKEYKELSGLQHEAVVPGAEPVVALQELETMEAWSCDTEL
nr:hypothetical protein [Candidatus Sigynarchaeota archaeon]